MKQYKTILAIASSVLIVMILVLAYGAESNDASLVGYWKFNSDSATDYSGQNNHGTVYGAVNTSDGKFEDALSFDGVNDYVDLGTSNTLKPTAFTITAWFKKNNLARSEAFIANAYWGLYYDYNCRFTGSVWCQVQSASATGNSNQITIPDNNWHFFAIIYDSSTNQFDIWLDNITNASTTTIDIAYSSRSTLIGYLSGAPSSLYFNGTIDEVRIYNRALSAEEILSQYNTQKHLFVKDGTLDSGDTSLVGYWKLDSVNSTNYTLDISGNNNDGRLINMSITGNASSGPTTDCKFRNCLRFDGVDDYVDVPTSSTLTITSTITLEAWVKPGVVNPYGNIISKESATAGKSQYDLRHGQVTTDSKFTFFYMGTNDVYQGYSTNAQFSDTAKWYHVVAVWTFGDSTSAKIYVDGVLEAGSWWIGTGNVAAYSDNGGLDIGRFITAIQYYNGLIDEVRIYNRTLSAEEILSQYNTQKHLFVKDGTLDLDDSSLVGYWKLDSVNSTNYTLDISGNNNDGRLINMSITGNASSGPTTDCKFRNCLRFDGVDDYVDVPTSSTLTITSTITLEAWVKPGVVNPYGNIISKESATAGKSQYDLRHGQVTTDSKFTFFYMGTNDVYQGYSTNAQFSDTAKWYHVVAVWTFGDSTSAKIYVDGVLEAGSWWIGTGNVAAYSDNGGLDIGRFITAIQYYNGLIDEVRIYNRTLSAEEILSQYNTQKHLFVKDGTLDLDDSSLVGYWKFNSDSATDYSGQNNQGTVYGAVNTSDGKFGDALSFDGVNDYVDLTGGSFPTGSSERTIEGWFTADNTKIQSFFDYGTDATGQRWSITANSSDIAVAVNGHNRGKTDLSLTGWHHIATVFPSGATTSNQILIYLDGVSQTLSDLVGSSKTVNTGSTYAYIGKSGSGGGNQNGLIDEVRIYNRSLSAEEIRQHYETKHFILRQS